MTASRRDLAGVEAMLREDFVRLELFRRFADPDRAEVAASRRDALAALARLLATPPRTVQDAFGTAVNRRFEDAELETLASLGARHAEVYAQRCSTAAVERATAASASVRRSAFATRTSPSPSGRSPSWGG